MIIYVVNDSEKVRIFLVRSGLSIHLNDRYVLNELYVNDTSLVMITPNQAFC